MDSHAKALSLALVKLLLLFGDCIEVELVVLLCRSCCHIRFPFCFGWLDKCQKITLRATIDPLRLFAAKVCTCPTERPLRFGFPMKLALGAAHVLVTLAFGRSGLC
jgi:hypothetical protein